MAKYHLPRTDADCASPGCLNWADEGDLCRPHAWEAENPGEQFDPFVFRHPDDQGDRAVFHRFVNSAPDERRTSRSSSGMGSGQSTPPEEEPVVGERGPKPSWPGGYPEVIWRKEDDTLDPEDAEEEQDDEVDEPDDEDEEPEEDNEEEEQPEGW